jgi:hypothetical protein
MGSWRAEVPPVADEEGTAEEVGPDFEAVEAVLAAIGSDADEEGGFREERELDGSGGPGAAGASLGHRVAASVSVSRIGSQREILVCGRFRVIRSAAQAVSGARVGSRRA